MARYTDISVEIEHEEMYGRFKSNLPRKAELFAQLYVETGDAGLAYIKTHPDTDWENSHYSPTAMGMHFAKRKAVAKYIDELRKVHAMTHHATVDSLIAELEETRKAALDARVPQCGAAVSATMGKAKLLGLDRQVVDVVSTDGSLDIKASLSELFSTVTDSKNNPIEE